MNEEDIKKFNEENIKRIKEEIQNSKFGYMINSQNVELLFNEKFLILHAKNEKNSGFNIRNVHVYEYDDKIHISGMSSEESEGKDELCKTIKKK